VGNLLQEFDFTDCTPRQTFVLFDDFDLLDGKSRTRIILQVGKEYIGVRALTNLLAYMA